MGGLIFYNAIWFILLVLLFNTDLTNQIQNGIDIKNVRMSAISNMLGEGGDLSESNINRIKAKIQELDAELNNLIDVVYPEVRDLVAETSAQGDRSENAGYREARRRQAKTISRIRFLQKVLENSRVIDPDALPKDRVCLLSKVEFTNLSTNTRMKFEIVSPHEMNLEAGKISLKSPIGAALMDRKVGETVEAQTPSGILRLRIESITLD